MKSWKSIALVVLCGCLLVVGLDTATYASNGDSLLIGRLNKSTKPTVVQNRADGPALSLRTSRGDVPPLSVDSVALVTKLNADQVDGYGASDLVRMSQGSTANTFSNAPYTSMATTSLVAPRSGYVQVIAQFTALPPETACSNICFAAFDLYHPESGKASSQQYVTVPPSGFNFTPAFIVWAFPVDEGENTFQLRTSSGANTPSIANPVIQATFVPFDGDGKSDGAFAATKAAHPRAIR